MDISSELFVWIFVFQKAVRDFGKGKFDGTSKKFGLSYTTKHMQMVLFLLKFMQLVSIKD